MKIRGQFLHTYKGDWSLYCVANLKDDAAMLHGTPRAYAFPTPKPEAHPFTWHIETEGKRIAWGTAPANPSTDDLIDLLLLWQQEAITFVNRSRPEDTRRFTLTEGWAPTSNQ